MRIVEKVSSEKTTRYVQENIVGARVSSAYQDLGSSHRIVLSTATGCLGCLHCPAKLDGGPLSLGELFIQGKLVYDDMALQKTTERGAPDTPVEFSLSGEGEPLASREAFVASIGALRALAEVTGRSRLAIWTIGPDPAMIRDLASERFPVELTLTISVASAIQGVASALAPRSPDLTSLRGAVGFYEMASQRPVEWAIPLIDRVNDDVNSAMMLAVLVGPGARVKIIPVSETRGLKPSPRTAEFHGWLSRLGIKPEVVEQA